MNFYSLSDKTVLVTGGARRIGAVIVQVLHQAGANVIIHYNQSKQEALQLKEVLNNKRADSAYVIQADLSKDSLSNLMQQAIAWKGKLHGLVNNASLFYPTELQISAESEWQELMHVNAFVPYQLSLLAKDTLMQSQGAIINIVDIHAEKPLRDYSLYCQSKAALRQQTLSLAKELAPNIRVNAVAPGAILWPEDKAELSLTQKESLLANIPLQRMGTPEEIAEAVLYLATASYVTGVILPVEGGRLLTK